MDSLAGYTSDDENTTKALPKTEPSPERPLPAFDNFVTYSENYAMKSKNLRSSFICLPWKVRQEHREHIRQCYKRVLDRLYKDIPSLKTRYSFHCSIQSKQDIYGRYGMSQKSAMNSPHITLLPNLHGDQNDFQRIDHSLRKAVKNAEPAPSQLIQKLEGPLGNMLNRSEEVVSLRIDDKVMAFMSSRTGNFFIALNVIGPTQQMELPEKTYLRSLMRMVYEQVSQQGLKCQWEKFLGKDPSYNADGLPEVNYHCLFLIGEANSFEERLSRPQFDRVKKLARDVDISDVVHDMRIEFDSLYLGSNTRVKNVYSLFKK